MSIEALVCQTRNLFATIAIAAISGSVQAQETHVGYDLYCHIAEKNAEGEWTAQRRLTIRNGVAQSARDSYRWQPKERIQFGRGMTLEWNIEYNDRAHRPQPKTIPQDEVAAILDFRYDAEHLDRPLENPQRSWIHFYRSTKSDEDFTVTATSLSSSMIWEKSRNGSLSTEAVIPLDSLLAFGTGLNTLAWNIRTSPNAYGGTHALSRGVLPIATMRGKASEIAKLRRLLDKRAANFSTQCNAPIIDVSG